jgi:hypothetical protein
MNWIILGLYSSWISQLFSSVKGAGASLTELSSWERYLKLVGSSYSTFKWRAWIKITCSSYSRSSDFSGNLLGKFLVIFGVSCLRLILSCFNQATFIKVELAFILFCVCKYVSTYLLKWYYSFSCKYLTSNSHALLFFLDYLLSSSDWVVCNIIE